MKTYKTSTQIFHVLSGKSAHPLELPGMSQKYKDRRVDLLTLSERSHQSLHGFKKTT